MDVEAFRLELPDVAGIALDDLEFYEAVIQRANELQAKMITDARFKIDPENQLRFVWKI